MEGRGTTLPPQPGEGSEHSGLCLREKNKCLESQWLLLSLWGPSPASGQDLLGAISESHSQAGEQSPSPAPG